MNDLDLERLDELSKLRMDVVFWKGLTVICFLGNLALIAYVLFRR